MTEENKILELFECECVPEFSIVMHGDGYALYYGRCNHRHGYNLVNMVEPAFNFDPDHIEKLINLGNQKYWDEYPKHGEGYLAE